eukprot:6269300-Amphidinium_carterae.1
MRLTEVHKPFAIRVSASFLTSERFRKTVCQASTLKRMHAAKLRDGYERLAVPLYQEKGVYNLYVKRSAGLNGQNLGATSAEAARLVTQDAASMDRRGADRERPAAQPAI